MAKNLRGDHRGGSEVKHLPSHRPQSNLTTQRSKGKSAHCLLEAWASAPAVETVTKPTRCPGVLKTPQGRLSGQRRPGTTVAMSVLDVLWEDRDVRFDVSSQ